MRLKASNEIKFNIIGNIKMFLNLKWWFLSDLGEALTLERLKKRRDFLFAAKGKYVRSNTLALQARARAKKTVDGIRVGFTCSKKVGNAVTRNRAKRRLREAARICLSGLGRPGWDYVLIGQVAKTKNFKFESLLTDLRGSIEKIHASSPKWHL